MLILSCFQVLRHRKWSVDGNIVPNHTKDCPALHNMLTCLFIKKYGLRVWVYGLISANTMCSLLIKDIQRPGHRPRTSCITPHWKVPKGCWGLNTHLLQPFCPLPKGERQTSSVGGIERKDLATALCPSLSRGHGHSDAQLHELAGKQRASPERQGNPLAKEMEFSEGIWRSPCGYTVTHFFNSALRVVRTRLWIPPV